MRIARSICWLLLLSGVLLYRLDGASAEVSNAAKQACTPDAMRLCAEFIPDVAKVTACMSAKHAQLSEPCRVAMADGGKHEKHQRREKREPRHHRRVAGHCDPFSHLCS
ncbi:MAG: hypothetical protein WAL80_17755 [Xanthobacteraceae bacterium]|jgi:hypothetical protein